MTQVCAMETKVKEVIEPCGGRDASPYDPAGCVLQPASWRLVTRATGALGPGQDPQRRLRHPRAQVAATGK